MKMNKVIPVLSLAALAAISLPKHGDAADMQMLTSWSSTYPVIEVAQDFADMVKTASDGEMTIELRGPETVPPFEQLEPVAAGVFDLVFTHPAYHTGTTGIALGLEATDGDPQKRRDVGAWDAVDAQYGKLGLKLISLPVSGKEGFMILLKEPVGEDGGLKGRKIRAAPIYQPLIEALGGSAVVLPPAEIYSALDRGVVDGAVWPIFGPLQFKWYEVAPYMMRPTFGVVTHQIFMNKDKWDALSAEDQAIMLKAGADLEKAAYQEFTDRASAELDAMEKAGAKYTDLGATQKAELDKIWRDGVWGLASSISGADADNLRAMLKKNGMTD